ncbi:MAG TPA: hypothetical protein PKE69_09090 [Pyrinomonadaceae bacterium]|nr:hypothetical protein [Pyrinomonadaceae bacterium]
MKLNYKAIFIVVLILSIIAQSKITTNQKTTNFNIVPQIAEPILLKRTIVVKPHRFLRWWKNSSAAEPVYDTWSWSPEIKFAINGPVTNGSQIFVEFDTADGKPWFTQRMRTPVLEADYWENVESVEDITFDQLEKKAITAQTGLFPFRIRLKNSLEGTDKILFSGKYKISTYTPDQKIPEYKGKKEFYIDEDWRLPMAWLWLNATDNEDAPILNLQTWFKNSLESENVEAFLYFNGRQIVSVKSNSAEETLTNSVDEKPFRYSLRTFYFYTVRGFNNNSSGVYRDSHFLDKNKGEYEIKVLRNGELARLLKFTVGPDGKIVDNNIVKTNKIGGIRMLLPIKIVGTTDGTFNATVYQTDAFYANPLSGFGAIQ